MKTTTIKVARSTPHLEVNSMGIVGKFRWQSRLVLVFTLTSLAACQTTAKMEPVQSTSYTARHSIVVTNDVVRISVHGNGSRHGLTSDQRNRIETFIAGYKDTGSGPLRIEAPSSSVNDVRAAGTIVALRRIIERNSIARSRVRTVNYYPRNRRRSSPVIISYRRYAAIAPKCGDWPESNTKTNKNAPAWSFGCASQSNMAAMIANPRDLIEPRASAPADAQRRDKIFQKYRDGDVTTAARSNAETGTVSAVAKQ